MPQPPGARKRLRAGLWGPFLVAGLAILAWSAGWLFAAREVERRLDAGVRSLASAGVTAAWSAQSLSGYPFRLNLGLKDLRVETGSWSARVPDLEAQAFLHAPRSWLIAAPEGLTVFRPEGGGLEVRGELLLSSLVVPKSGPPRLSAEGLGLTFTPSPGARPFALASAGQMELHVRPGPEDRAAVFLRLEEGRPTPGRVLADLGGGGEAAATLEGLVDHASALKGASLADGLAAWGAAGGRLELKAAGLTAGEARLSVTSSGLGAGPDGRLSGPLTLTAAKAPRILVTLARHGVISPAEAAGGLAAFLLGRSGADDVRIDLELSGGKVRLARKAASGDAAPGPGGA